MGSYRVHRVYYPYRDDPKVLLVVLEDCRTEPLNSNEHLDKKLKTDDQVRGVPFVYGISLAFL